MLRVLTRVLELAFPWACPVCKVGFEGDGPLCPTCARELATIERLAACPLCAAPLPMHGSPCPYCMNKGAPFFERVVRLAPYTDPLRLLIHQLKYHRRWTIGEYLADRLLEREPAKALLQETDVLLAVPLHWRRQFPRGYNQAEVIARRLGSRCGLKRVRPVKRIRHTETQTHLHSQARRQENLKEAFRLMRPGEIAGKHVTIIDDVWTTGATMQALARTLRPARPASLSALVIAAADPKGYERVSGAGG